MPVSKLRDWNVSAFPAVGQGMISTCDFLHFAISSLIFVSFSQSQLIYAAFPFLPPPNMWY